MFGWLVEFWQLSKQHDGTHVKSQMQLELMTSMKDGDNMKIYDANVVIPTENSDYSYSALVYVFELR